MIGILCLRFRTYGRWTSFSGHQRVRIRTFSPTFEAHLKRGRKVSILQLHKRGFVTVTESLIADKPTKVIVVIHAM